MDKDRKGPFDTLAEAEAFVKGVEYAHSFYGDVDISVLQPSGEPYEVDGEWYIDLEWTDAWEDEDDDFDDEVA